MAEADAEVPSVAGLHIDDQEKSCRVPFPGKRNVLVTSALPYCNNWPHLGNLIGAVLSADVYARYLRARQVNVIYICGTDEYGTATETKAQQENLTPKEICDKYHALHKDVYDWFDISFDEFGRTSTEHQTKIVQDVFWEVYNRGYIVEDTMTQLYCEAVCHRVLADRYVNGTCPSCGFEGARGDQCDSCSRMLNTTELVRPRCATCGNPPVTKSTKHLFLDLPKIQDELETWFESSSEAGSWSANSIRLTNTWLRDGLKKRCITRDLQWGVPVPLKGYEDKVFYVWFDAPIGYISITAGYGDRMQVSQADGEPFWQKWWRPSDKDECNVELVQFMGKDNTPFHTIVFPATLLATGQPWTMLHQVSTTDYLNYENGKFSKGNGVGVFGNDAKQTGIPTEVWRYYLLLNRPEGADSNFMWIDLGAKNNDELIKNLGNFINRTVSFLFKFFEGSVPQLLDNDGENEEFVSRINVELNEYMEQMEKVNLKAGLKKAMQISSLGNLYLQTKQPWKLFKEGQKNAAGSSLTFSANLVILVCVILEPFLGSRFSSKVYKQLGLVHREGVNNLIPSEFDPTLWIKAGSKTGKAEILFHTLDDERLNELRKQYSGRPCEVQPMSAAMSKATSEDAFQLDLRVGHVVEVTEHPDSERLFVGKIDLNEPSGPRSVVAGLRDAYTNEELLHRKVVVVCNLAPASLAGVQSQCMILCADKKKIVKVLCVPDKLSVGDQISPAGMTRPTIFQSLDRAGFQAASKPLRVGQAGVVMYDKQYPLAAISDTEAKITSSGVAEGGKIK